MIIYFVITKLECKVINLSNGNIYWAYKSQVYRRTDMNT